CAGVVDVAVAASITLPEHSNLASIEFRSECYCGKSDVRVRPGGGQSSDWAVLRRRRDWPVFERLHPSHAPGATIHLPIHARVCSRTSTDTNQPCPLRRTIPPVV